MSKIIQILIILMFLTGCSEPLPNHLDFNVGMSQQELTTAFGPPTKIQSITKHDGPIWGPIESIWDEVPLGSQITIWSYQTEAPIFGAFERTGETQLYFVDSSTVVDEIAFRLLEAVYENSPDHSDPPQVPTPSNP